MLAIRVLIVEDDPIISEDIKDILTNVNYQVVGTAYDKDEAIEAIDALKDGTYSDEKVDKWMEELSSVYNRGFWSGYYLGQKMGEWSKQHGSQATKKKVYLGKGLHYFPKPKIGHFKMEALDLKLGDRVLITGPTTGVIEIDVDQLMVDSISVNKTKKGEEFTMPIDQIIRPSDKLYKIVAS